MNSSHTPIRPYTHKQLCALYGVSWPTLQKWLKPIEDILGEKEGHFYTSRQVRIIFTHVGPPDGDYLQKAS